MVAGVVSDDVLHPVASAVWRQVVTDFLAELVAVARDNERNLPKAISLSGKAVSMNSGGRALQ